MGARLLYDETTANTDALGPENIPTTMTGPFTDAGISGLKLFQNVLDISHDCIHFAINQPP